MHLMSVTYAFVGHAPPETAAQASAYEDEAIALFADHGGELLSRVRRRPDQDASLPWEVHLFRFPSRQALAAYLADPRRHALLERYGEVFSSKQTIEVEVLTGDARPVRSDDHLAFYAEPGRHTTLSVEDTVSGGVREIVAAVQGLLIYDVVAEAFYGVELSPAQADTIHERDSARLLAAARAVDSRPLDQPRPPGARVGARCHAYSRLTVAFLRSNGVPARARCGFGSYFVPGLLEDHWVAEYWDEDARRWKMVDAQLDATWRSRIGFDGDPFDLTAEEFVTAGHAWQAWRTGTLDAGTCGLSAIREHGDHWIAGNLRLDLASLNKVEMLPWDVWGAGWEPGGAPTDDQLELFDGVAALTTDPDAGFQGLRTTYDSDDRLRMDGTVFNVGRGDFETV